ncbi:MAG: hypothetical protein LBO71_01075 [Prevotellaceae bacterium]|nr:hypothetical protein [Prevotellaceae bacterium]
MKRYLFISLLYICCCSAIAHAQPSPQPKEVDVVYFKDGGILRGEIIGRSAKTGKIRLQDGSVIVYKKSTVKMTSKELLQVSEQSAKEDSLKIVGIAKKTLEEEAEKRRAEEELRALQKMVDASMNAHSSMLDDDDHHTEVRLYSMMDVGFGAGFGDLPSSEAQRALSKTPNTHKLVSVRYAVGGRGDHFGMGVSFGIQHLRKSGGLGAPADSSGAMLPAADTMPSNLLFFPVGLDMRLEFLPDAPASPFISANASYAIGLNSGKDKNAEGFFIVNPAIGMRFGRDVSSLLSLGFQLHTEPDGKAIHFFTLRFGVIF